MGGEKTAGMRLGRGEPDFASPQAQFTGHRNKISVARDYDKRINAGAAHGQLHSVGSQLHVGTVFSSATGWHFNQFDSLFAEVVLVLREPAPVAVGTAENNTSCCGDLPQYVADQVLIVLNNVFEVD